MIQIDMPMPTNCLDCPACNEYLMCAITPVDGRSWGENYVREFGQGRPEWCPMKEQEAVKPVLDEQTGRIWLCGKCGSYVGFEDNDPHDPNEFDKYCRECGRPVLWEGR